MGTKKKKKATGKKKRDKNWSINIGRKGRREQKKQQKKGTK